MKRRAKQRTISPAAEAVTCAKCPCGELRGGERHLVLERQRAALRRRGNVQAERVRQFFERDAWLQRHHQAGGLLQQAQSESLCSRLAGVEGGVRGSPDAKRRKLRVDTVPHQPPAADVQPGHFGGGAELSIRRAGLLLLKYAAGRRAGGQSLAPGERRAG